MANENGFTDTTDQDGPEPAEEKRAYEAAQSRIEEDAVSCPVSEVTGNRGEEKSRTASGKKNELHGWALNLTTRPKRATSRAIKNLGFCFKGKRGDSVSVLRQGSPGDRATDVFLAITGQRWSGRREQRLKIFIEKVVP